VAIVSPSAPAVGRWPHRAERRRGYLEGLGLKVQTMPNATRVTGWTAGSVQERADDLHAAFADLGVFDAIVGLVLGRPMRYSPENTEVLWEVASKHMRDRSIPVLANIDCGHTDPMVTLPVGIEVRLDSAADSFTTTEVATSPGSTRPSPDPADR
jgi:muramoyltetrapeptide carboxypeptidase LdcA involved in peptidoglycan recycling